MTQARSLDLRAIATLARLELTDREIDVFSQQLRDVLTYAEQVQDVDTTGVPPTSHPFADRLVWRDDEPRPSLPRDDVLADAPGASVRAGLFKVPKVL